MTDTSDLGKRIKTYSELSHTAGPDGWTLLSHQSDQLRASLVAEIEQTRLPRTLHFNTDQSKFLDLQVHNGRIFSVKTGDETKTLSTAEDETLIQTLVAQLLSSAQTLYVKTTRWTPDTGDNTVGLLPQTLIENHQPTSPHSDPLAELWVQDNKVLSETGASAELAALKNLRAAGIDFENILRIGQEIDPCDSIEFAAFNASHRLTVTRHGEQFQISLR